MCVLLFDSFSGFSFKDFKHLISRKTDVFKASIFSEKSLKKCTNFEEQKRTRDTRGNFYFDIIVFGCFSSTKPCLRFLLIDFTREMKGFYQSFLGNKVDFTDVMNVP